MRVPQIKVLVIEHHPDYCSYVALLLRNELGDRVKIETAQNAIEALSLVASFAPELVIVGMNSPHFQPEIFMQTIRKRHPQIDVLALTSNSVEEAERLGASKAFKMGEVNPKLPQYIREQNWGHVIARRLRYFGFPMAKVV